MVLSASCATPHEPARIPAPVEPTSPPAAAPASAPSQKGIEAGDVNRSIDPCSDFFEFANGTWRARNPIAEGKPKASRRALGRDRNRQQVAALIQELSTKADWPAGSAEQLVGDLHASCMDEAAADTAGLAPIAPLLADIDAARTPADVQRAIRRLHDVGIAGPFGELGAFDNHEPKDYLLSFAAGSLGLGDRDAYLKTDPKAVELRARYRQHVARVLVLGGTPEKASLAAADGVIALEKRLAGASLEAKIASDPAATEHRTTFAQLKALAPRLDWDAYFDEAKLPREPVNVAEPKLVQQVDKELKATPVATWKSYLRFQLVDAASPWLSKPFVEESFAFKDKALGGASDPTPRADRCVELTETLLGEPVGKTYADRYFPPAAKAKAQEIATNLVAVIRAELAAVPWMAAETKQKALEKLDLMRVQIGYPDRWKDVSSLQIRRDALWANITRARKYNLDDVRRQAGKPSDRDGWQLPASSPAAYLDPQLNELVLPAGFLQPPYFDASATDAVNYGAFGSGLAHDMTHAFDVTGADLDAAGRAQPWWTDADRKAFAQRTQCIVDQYEGYAIEPGVHHNGKLVLNEALGDQAGIHFSYLAFEKSMATRPGQRGSIDGYTPAQQFFLAWAQFRGEAVRLEVQRNLIKGDTHAMPKFRVIGPLVNLPEFERAFACKAGAPMVRTAAQRCVVW